MTAKPHCWLVAAATLLASVVPGGAHGPFDNSVRLYVMSDRLEVGLTLGMDAAREVLRYAGLDEAAMEEALLVRGPGSAYRVQTAVASGLIAVSLAEQRLLPTETSIHTDGLEVLIAMDYPRAGAGETTVQALYFEAVPELRQGAFVALDENGNSLGSALLSPAGDAATFQLPAASHGVQPVNSLASATAAQAGSPVATPVNPGESDLGGSLSQPSFEPARPTFGAFLLLGIKHILLGFDHLLFLGALLVGIRKLGATLLVITAFTLAHSVTLAVAALGWVVIPSRVVEPLIAASIIVVCVENLLRQNAAQDRFWLAAGFGLIHGFGFASVLREIGLGADGLSIVSPLLAFNLGVEVGQLAVAALVVPVLFVLRERPAFVRYGIPIISTLVLVVSGYWLLERTVLAGGS